GTRASSQGIATEAARRTPRCAIRGTGGGGAEAGSVVTFGYTVLHRQRWHAHCVLRHGRRAADREDGDLDVAPAIRLGKSDLAALDRRLSGAKSAHSLRRTRQRSLRPRGERPVLRGDAVGPRGR